MAPSNKVRNTGCPITFALDTFGDRWSLLIVRDLLMRGYRTNGEFQRSNEGIATNILADRLRRLEKSGIISQSPDPQNRRRILYKLTAKGVDLAPVMVELMRWSGKYDEGTRMPKQIKKRIEREREDFIRALQVRALDVE